MPAPRADRDAYLEELIVRRELSVNHVCYNPRYDSFEGLPDWAKRTLAEHARDQRYHVYTRGQLERAATHDRWWNAAQLEMTRSGYMHNYMRMYWGKKILEWSPISYVDRISPRPLMILTTGEHDVVHPLWFVLDADPSPGGAWQHRWDSLTMRDVHGVVHVVPNGEITSVSNLTRVCRRNKGGRWRYLPMGG